MTPPRWACVNDPTPLPGVVQLTRAHRHGGDHGPLRSPEIVPRIRHTTKMARSTQAQVGTSVRYGGGSGGGGGRQPGGGAGPPGGGAGGGAPLPGGAPGGASNGDLAGNSGVGPGGPVDGPPGGWSLCELT